MADINMTPLGAIGAMNDRFLVAERMAGIKKCVIRETYTKGTRIVLLEFPEIGHSLPGFINGDYLDNGNIVAIYQIDAVEGEAAEVYVSIIEYAAQPDMRYFEISGVDENGDPVYRGPKTNGKSVSSLSMGD